MRHGEEIAPSLLNGIPDAIEDANGSTLTGEGGPRRTTEKIAETMIGWSGAG